MFKDGARLRLEIVQMSLIQ